MTGREVLRRVLASLGFGRSDADLAGELEFHRQMLVRRSAAQRVFVTRVLSAFAAAAVLLAAIGLYGLVAHIVSERTREIGVRVALGAQRADVVWMVLSTGASIVGVGVLGGVLAAAASVRFIRTLIFGVRPTACTAVRPDRRSRGC